MQPYPKQPVIDVQNPCYCPSLPARAYIHNLHQRLATNSGIARTLRVVNSFPHILSKAVNTPGIFPGDKGVDDSDWETSGSDSRSDTSTATTTTSSSSSSGSTDSGDGQARSPSARKTSSVLRIRDSGAPTNGAEVSATATTGTSDNQSFNESHFPVLNGFGHLRDSRLLACPPFKRKDSDRTSESGDSDIRGPSKRIKSLPGTNQKSFEVRLKREYLNFDLPSSEHLAHISRLSASTSSSLASLDLEYLQATRTETPAVNGPGEAETLIDEIKQVIPGIRIPPDVQEPQAVTRYLAENGLLTASLLALIGRYLSVQDLSLSQSLIEHNGLNLDRVPELLPALHPPGRFIGLINLCCDGAPLKDDDVVHFHNLPLQSISLRRTGISNTAIFLLVSLRHTLLQLFIDANSGITDDAIPALSMFKKLKRLKLNGTKVKMDGLRRFAAEVHKEERIIHVGLPNTSWLYLSGMSSYYLLEIKPPLISECETVWRASLAELRTNLVAHSVVNRGISVAGNKAELRERLIELLRCRKGDLLVKKMLEDGERLGAAEGEFGGALGISGEDSGDEVVSDGYEEEWKKIVQRFG